MADHYGEHIAKLLVDQVLGIVGDLRGQGWVVALVTNATSRLDQDLTDLGISERFDVIVNSVEVGVAKPSDAIYYHAVSALHSSPERRLFVEIKEQNVVSARRRGISGVVFGTPDDLRRGISNLKPRR